MVGALRKVATAIFILQNQNRKRWSLSALSLRLSCEILIKQMLRLLSCQLYLCKQLGLLSKKKGDTIKCDVTTQGMGATYL